MSVRINERSNDLRDETMITREKALGICLSFTNECETKSKYKSGLRLLSRIDNRGQEKQLLLQLPCGYITTVNNPMIHLHRCVFEFHKMLPKYGFSDMMMTGHNIYNCNHCQAPHYNKILSYKCCQNIA